MKQAVLAPIQLEPIDLCCCFLT